MRERAERQLWRSGLEDPGCEPVPILVVPEGVLVASRARPFNRHDYDEIGLNSLDCHLVACDSSHVESKAICGGLVHVRSLPQCR